jgi:hypothetical protein
LERSYKSRIGEHKPHFDHLARTLDPVAIYISS